MSAETLEPGLTKADKRVLRKIPSFDDATAEFPTIWRLGEELNQLDLVDLKRTLYGLQHLGYIAMILTRGYSQLGRLRKGDEALR